MPRTIFEVHILDTDLSEWLEEKAKDWLVQEGLITRGSSLVTTEIEYVAGFGVIVHLDPDP